MRVDSLSIYSHDTRNDFKESLGLKFCRFTLYLNAKETQPFSIHFFFHMDHMMLIS